MYLETCRYQKIFNYCKRQIHTNTSRILFNQYNNAAHQKRIRSSRLYWGGFGILVLGFTYASVPLYRVFCQVMLMFLILLVMKYVLSMFITTL